MHPGHLNLVPDLNKVGLSGFHWDAKGAPKGGARRDFLRHFGGILWFKPKVAFLS